MSVQIPDKSLLTFSLGPVQSFIESARTVRDLWAGSYLLAWLTAHAMTPILKAQQQADDGESWLIFPDLSGHPLPEWIMQGKPTFDPVTDRDKLAKFLSPCLPNRFLAEIPSGQAAKLEDDIRQACLEAWRDIGSKVLKRIEETLAYQGIVHRDQFDSSIWNDQLESFFEIRTISLPSAGYDERRLNELQADFTLTTTSSTEEIWKARWVVMGKLLTASRAVRHVPSYLGRSPKSVPLHNVAMKCSLLGSYEQMGPGHLASSKAFWEAFSNDVRIGPARTRPSERLSAISLVKRFAWHAAMRNAVIVKPEAGGQRHDPAPLRYPDTATVAAAEWLRVTPDVKGDFELESESIDNWSGQWLHWTNDHQDKDEACVPKEIWSQIERKRSVRGKAPAYYAIIMLDGDKMGGKLKNATSNDQRRISGVLSRFALEPAREIVEDHCGVLIYSGGDDVLAMLPVSQALSCADALEREFRKLWRVEFEKDGKLDKVSVSAGIAVVHYKEDLRFALGEARGAEKLAKGMGRNCLTLSICRRSGEHTRVTLPWALASDAPTSVPSANGSASPVISVAGLVRAFMAKGVSDRWVYHLTQEKHTLRGLPSAEAMKLEIKRQLRRSDITTLTAIPTDQVAAAFDDYCKFRLCKDPDRRPTEPSFRNIFKTEAVQALEISARAFEDFVTLCQSASFLARGRDR